MFYKYKLTKIETKKRFSCKKTPVFRLSSTTAENLQTGLHLGGALSHPATPKQSLLSIMALCRVSLRLHHCLFLTAKRLTIDKDA